MKKAINLLTTTICLTECSEQRMMEVVPWSERILFILSIGAAILLVTEREKQGKSCLVSIILSCCIVGGIILFNIYAPLWLQYIVSFFVLIIVMAILAEIRK